MFTEFFINWLEEPIKYFEIGQEDNKCEISNGILGTNVQKIQKSFQNYEKAKEFFDNEKKNIIENGYFETLEQPKVSDIIKDKDIGLYIKLDYDCYSYLYLEAFKTGVLIFFDTNNGEITNRSKNIYKELIKKQKEIKNKIDIAFFNHHKEVIERNINTYKKFDMPIDHEMMEMLDKIKKAITLEEKQKVLYKEIKLKEIKIFYEDWNDDIGFGFEYDNFDPEHGLGIKLKNWEVLEVCSNADLW